MAGKRTYEPHRHRIDDRVHGVRRRTGDRRSRTRDIASWDARAAAAYLDGRQGWWMTWSGANRDHDTQCVSCHTALPYALARPALRGPLGEHDASPTERRMLEDVTKRVRMWKEIEPFYPDQLRGLPKTSESRGTEAILNAVILSTRDAHAGAMSADGRQAFENLWPLQFKTGERSGGWAWLDFHNEPWEAPGSQYFGNSLAAIAIGSAPEGYASTPAIQERIKPLATFLRGGAENATLLNRAMILWAVGEDSRRPDAGTAAAHHRRPGRQAAERRRLGDRIAGRRLETQRQDAARP